MKKILLSLVAFTSFGMAAQAQVTIIPKAGVTFSNIAFKENQEGQGSTTGLVLGAGFNFALDQDAFFSIQPEILYTQKGFRTKTFNNADSRERQYTLNYLEVPVLAKIAFGSETIKGYVNAGPSLGFGLGGKRLKTDLNNGVAKTEEISVQFGKEPESYTGKDEFIDNRMDFGLQFGGGVGIKLGPGSLLLDMRYGLGMSNLIDADPNQTTSDANKSQNRVIALSLGYAIPLGGR
jgi:opacity protein-like surface antigen